MIVRALERRATSINPRHPGDPGVASIFGLGRDTSSGVDVGDSTAMNHAAVYAAVRVRAETLASAPLHLYETTASGLRQAREYPLFRLLYGAPNEEMTAAEFWEAIGTNLELRGNGLAQIVRTNGGTIDSLWPLRADCVRILRDDQTGQMVYEVEVPRAGKRHLLPSDVFHVKLFGASGLWGLSPIDQNMEAIGASIAAERFGARYFKNGATPSLALESTKPLGKEGPERLRQSISALFSPMEKKHGVLVLEDGMTAKQIGIAPEAAQFLETRKFQLREIARIFRIPPHLLQDLEQATFSNISEQSLEFVKYSMLPEFRKIEQAIWRSMLTPKEQATYYARFALEGLLRGDPKTRAEYYRTMHGFGAMSVDEIRALEEMNPLEDGSGGLYLSPMNSVPSDMFREYAAAQIASKTPPAPAEPAKSEGAQRSSLDSEALARAFAPQLADAIRRNARILRRDLVAAAREQLEKRGLDAYADWILARDKRQREEIAAAVAPTLQGLATLAPVPADSGAQIADWLWRAALAAIDGRPDATEIDAALESIERLHDLAEGKLLEILGGVTNAAA